MSQSEKTGSVLVEKGATAGEWRVRVEKRWKNQSASGEVIVRADEEPSQPSEEQETLAGSRAWLALGRAFLAGGDAENAVECARQGLETLGDDYASPTVDDDTGMKLFAAEERITEGHAQDGAEVMLRILDIRTRLSAERTGLRLPD